MVRLDFTPRKVRSKYPLEVDEQKAVWAWLGTVHPTRHGMMSITGTGDVNPLISLQDFSFHCPNGAQLAGSRGRRAAAMSSLKAQGFRNGVSDLVIAYPTFREGYHGMGGGADSSGYFGAYIELKREPAAYGGPAAKRAAVRPEQIEWLERMQGAGYWTSISYGRQDCYSQVESYLRNESPRPLDFIPQ